jgi:hypothetical protein
MWSFYRVREVCAKGVRNGDGGNESVYRRIVDNRHQVDWFVPVRCVDGVAVVRTGRLPDGVRVGIAFGTSADLRAACGVQEWMRMSDDGLRQLLEPLGIERIQLDPTLVAVPMTAAAAG